ncbi:chloride channel protein [Dyadobacter bucti]|uniref:chloride channel protein n=1 Tax=Dyadobacter bucti TaxID=2572203 RepID=UPI00140DD87F|nr:chloride channel protein [Dyadobacter bucti]
MIEASTVVATSIHRRPVQRESGPPEKIQADLISAGLPAGVTALFNATVTDFLFALVVFVKRRSRLLFIPVTLACLISKFIAHLVFPFTVYTYKDAALIADKQM